MRLGSGLLLLTFVSGALAQDVSAPQHAIEDWSTRHIMFTGLTTENLGDSIRKDPRAFDSWLKHARFNYDSAGHFGEERISNRRNRDRRRRDGERLKRDWQMPIGSNAPEWASPAKFGFDVTAAPDCTNDYVVFPTANRPAPGASGSFVLPSLIAFNNLYTGPGPTGICPTPSSPAAQPSVLFAYNTSTASQGQAALSPVLSLDGKMIAFVESNDGSGNNYTAFHVLTWKAGEGAWLSAALPGNCQPGNSCMTTLVLNNQSSDTFSNPFVDYAHDTAYVADDGGFLHKIAPVFSGTPQEVIGGGWPVNLSSFSLLQSPVYDSITGRIFILGHPGVTCNMLVIDDASGAIIANDSISCFSGSDPIVDSSNQTVFTFVNAFPSQSLTVQQFDTSGTLLRQISMPGVAFGRIHQGAFDHNYFTNSSSGSLYFANSGTGLFRVGFTGAVMNSSFNGPMTFVGGGNLTGLTEIFNPTLSTAQDRLFLGTSGGCTSAGSNGCINSIDISGGLPSGILNSYNYCGFASPPPLSGIIVDNVSSAPQASSIYFEATPSCSGGGPAAIKLTQAALQ